MNYDKLPEKDESVYADEPNFDPRFEQTDSIKLIKNSRGYNWEIKILSLDVDKIAELNKRMDGHFGKKDNS